MEDEEDVDAESAPILMLEKDSDYIPNLFGADCIQNQITKLDLSHYPKLRCLHTMPQGHPTTMSLRQTEVSTIQSKSGKNTAIMRQALFQQRHFDLLNHLRVSQKLSSPPDG